MDKGGDSYVVVNIRSIDIGGDVQVAEEGDLTVTANSNRMT